MKVVGDPAFYGPLSVATDKGDPEFDAKIAEAVAAMKADGTLPKLSAQWYGVDLTAVDSAESPVFELARENPWLSRAIRFLVVAAALTVLGPCRTAPGDPLAPPFALGAAPCRGTGG